MGVLVIIPIIIMFTLFAFNVPVSFAMILSAMVYFIFMTTQMPMDMIVQSLVSGSQSYTLLAIPFFITAGSIMTYGGISKALLDFAEVLTGHMKGGLGQVNVLLSAFMGGISGSSNADCAFDCKVIVPQMERQGYSRGFSASISVASSVITPIIPPGICLIIYATVASQSVGDLFLAGYVPGILLTIALMITVNIISKKRNYMPSREKRASLKEILVQAKTSVWALILPFGIILGLRIGWFTPTECGAMTVIYAIFVGLFVYKKLKLKHFPNILFDSAISSATILLILCGANLFSFYLTWEQVPILFADFLMNFTTTKFQFLTFVTLLMMFIGMFFESQAALIILPPLLLPVAKNLGVDPIHLGIVMAMTDTIGGITPPFGSMMFTAMTITKIKVSQYIKEAWPMILAILIVLLIVVYIPDVSLFLVRLSA